MDTTTTTTTTTIIVENQPATPVVNPGLPPNFIRLDPIYCAFRCDYLDWPHCFGCKGATQFLCIEDEYYSCKCTPANNEQNVCFLLGSGVSDLTNPECRCKLYRQCFCFEWVCGCPLDESMLQPGEMLRNVESKEGLSNVYDAVPCNATCCTIDSCFCSFPACIGCVQRQQCLCVKNTAIYMKPLCWDKEREKQRSCCLLAKSNAVCYSTPTTCIKCMDQNFCLDRRCAFPCDEELTGRGANAPVPPPPAQTIVVHNIVQTPQPAQVVYIQQPAQEVAPHSSVQYAEAAPAQPTYVYAEGTVLTANASAPPVKDPNMV
eukprot:gene8180-9023_t